MSTYVVYTGTFTKQDGTTRTMRFIRSQDVPRSQFKNPASTMNRNLREGYEVVYDIERRGFVLSTGIAPLVKLPLKKPVSSFKT